ncbi:MAG: glycosyltransferase family 39 protein, partial [Acidobacteriaceae bacterium]|nr:glycosyltransferase family 39 protein [Acidobacteriaceae bacterium]
MLIRIAVAIYLFWSILLIAQQPGLQYDEALLVTDAVYMLHFRGVSTLPQDPNTWVSWGKIAFPLMTVRYVGPIKMYLCLPLFAIFGANAEVIRGVSVLLGAIGVWGFGALIAYLAGPRAGGLAALALACQPTFLSMTVFDNNAIAPIMAALGALCFAIRAYLRAPSKLAAFSIGAAAGFGIWARANYLWLLIALGVALIVVVRRFQPMHVAAAAAGGVLCGSPFIVYQVVSRGGTWQGLGMFVEHGSLWERIHARWYLLTELLWTARENRAIWGGPELLEWQRWLAFGILAAAVAVALWKGERAARIAAIACVALAAIMMPSRLELSEHHLILLMPYAIAVTVLACTALRMRWLAITLAAISLGSFVYWDVASMRGLARTGGVGMWSDSIYDVADYLQSKYASTPIQVLDWGLGLNLFVLSQG